MIVQEQESAMRSLIRLMGYLGLAGCLLAAPAGYVVAKEKKMESIVLGMGCFWGAERRMAQLPGVLDVESGYAGGDSVNTTYRQVLATETRLQRGLSKERNHAEVVKVRFDPLQVSLERVLAHFWENHDPTQGDRQGNDRGSNYRSAIYYADAAQHKIALKTREVYQEALARAGFPAITTEIAPLRNYTRAEDEHQDYL